MKRLEYYNKIIKYIFTNPNSLSILFRQRYDSVIANALYGEMEYVVQGDGINLLTIEDFLTKFNINVTREDIDVPYINVSNVGSVGVLVD